MDKVQVYELLIIHSFLFVSHSLNWIKEHNKGERVLVAAKDPALPSSSTEHNLPYFTKYLMIAAYLSSYNPVKTDRKFFSKVSEFTELHVSIVMNL